jgi:hypothetical protein
MHYIRCGEHYNIDWFKSVVNQWSLMMEAAYFFNFGLQMFVWDLLCL